jgi:bacillithiol system protein YtxJ
VKIYSQLQVDAGITKQFYRSQVRRIGLETLKELRTVKELEEALNQSHERPVLLFKHSLTCSISDRAFSEFKSHLNNPDPRISYRLITVQTARAVSDAAATRLNVEHESPQAILVRNGRELWNASHNQITAASLHEAVRKTD